MKNKKHTNQHTQCACSLNFVSHYLQACQIDTFWTGRKYETVSNGPPKEFAVKRCFYPSRVAVTTAKEHPQFEHYSINPGTWLQSILRTLQERWRHLQQIFSPSAVLSTMPVTMCLATVRSTRTQESDIFLWSSFKHCKKCPFHPWDHFSEFVR